MAPRTSPHPDDTQGITTQGFITLPPRGLLSHQPPVVYCHQTPLSGQRCPPGPSIPHVASRSQAGAMAIPQCLGIAQSQPPALSPQPRGTGKRPRLTPPVTGPEHRLTHHEDDFVLLELFWRRERKKIIIKSQKVHQGVRCPQGVPDPGQASLGMEGTDPRVLGGRWRGKQTRVLVTWAGWDVWTYLSTKTPWHLGHGAGIPLPHGVPEVVIVHDSTAARDWPHPYLWPACHPGRLIGVVAGLAWHGHLEHLAQPQQSLDPSIGPWTWWPTCKWHWPPIPCPAPWHRVLTTCGICAPAVGWGDARV